MSIYIILFLTIFIGYNVSLYFNNENTFPDTLTDGIVIIGKEKYLIINALLTLSAMLVLVSGYDMIGNSIVTLILCILGLTSVNTYIVFNKRQYKIDDLDDKYKLYISLVRLLLYFIILLTMSIIIYDGVYGIPVLILIYWIIMSVGVVFTELNVMYIHEISLYITYLSFFGILSIL